MTAKRIVVDLDDTICFPNHQFADTQRKYAEARPNEDMIKFLQMAKANGHYIIIHSARRMLTHNGDVEAIEADVGLITEAWLHAYHVPYDELVFGKPYGHYYIDDKAVNPFTNIILCDILT